MVLKTTLWLCLVLLINIPLAVSWCNNTYTKEPLSFERGRPGAVVPILLLDGYLLQLECCVNSTSPVVEWTVAGLPVTEFNGSLTLSEMNQVLSSSIYPPEGLYVCTAWSGAESINQTFNLTRTVWDRDCTLGTVGDVQKNYPPEDVYDVALHTTVQLQCTALLYCGNEGQIKNVQWWKVNDSNNAWIYLLYEGDRMADRATGDSITISSRYIDDSQNVLLVDLNLTIANVTFEDLYYDEVNCTGVTVNKSCTTVMEKECTTRSTQLCPTETLVDCTNAANTSCTATLQDNCTVEDVSSCSLVEHERCTFDSSNLCRPKAQKHYECQIVLEGTDDATQVLYSLSTKVKLHNNAKPTPNLAGVFASPRADESEWKREGTILGCVLGIFLLLVLMVVFIYVRYEWHIKLYLKRASLQARGRTAGSSKAYKYDCYIACCHEDEALVYDVIRDQLEKIFGYRLCLPERDFMIGAAIPEQITCYIESSEYFLAVISSNFWTTDWCNLSLDIALRTNVKVIAVYVLETPKAQVSQQPELAKALNAPGCCKLVFRKWKNVKGADNLTLKLRYAMPKLSGQTAHHENGNNLDIKVLPVHNKDLQGYDTLRMSAPYKPAKLERAVCENRMTQQDMPLPLSGTDEILKSTCLTSDETGMADLETCSSSSSSSNASYGGMHDFVLRATELSRNMGGTASPSIV